MKKYFFTLIILFFLCACNNKKQDDIIEKEPLSVNAVVAKNTPIQDETVAAVLLQGIKKATLYSQTIGTISLVSANLGDNVRAGQTLLSTQNSVQTANLEQAKGAFEEAQLNFSASERLYNNSNGISKAEYIRSQNVLLTSQAALAAAQKAYDDTKIIAPFDGIITSVNDIVQKGNNISVGQPLFSIVDISKLKANISVGEKEIGRIKKGAPALVKIAAINAQLNGTVWAISSGSDFQTGTFAVETVFKNPDFLVKDGMSGVISIEIGEPRIGIAIPSSAVLNGRSVFAAKGGRAQNLFVEFEQVSAGKILVKKGISQGDTVIVSGITQISQDDTLNISVVE
jgi:membrane fusion protein (multidrug efflux system)